MGLFRSSKKEPEAPLPSLELHLGHPRDTVIKPGDSIHGHILLSTPVIITPKAIEVTLWGESRTWIRKQSTSHNSTTNTSSTTYYHYRDHAPLFSVTQNVLSQPKERAHVPGQTYKMPFTFTMPTGTANNRLNCYQNPSSSIFIVSPHPLPPTFTRSHTDPGIPNNCLVSYGVAARLICPEFPPDRLLRNIPILFSPHNPHARVQIPNRVRMSSKTFKLSSSALSGVSPESIGFRQSMKDKLSSQTPKIEFQLAVELPDILTSGAEFAFKSTLDVLSKSENVTMVPSMQFRVLKLELLDFTLFRAPRDWQANSYRSGEPSKYRDGTPRRGFRGDDQEVCEEDKTRLNSLPEVATVELNEVRGEKRELGDRCEVWFRGRVPEWVPASFRSFAIARFYRIKVKIGVEIGGKGFDFVVEGPEVQIGSA